jgi:hypothetical protein
VGADRNGQSANTNIRPIGEQPFDAVAGEDRDLITTIDAREIPNRGRSPVLELMLRSRSTSAIGRRAKNDKGPFRDSPAGASFTRGRTPMRIIFDSAGVQRRFSGVHARRIGATRPRSRRGSRILTIEKVAVTDDTVSGEVLNRSPNVIRDIQLLIRYTWL